VDAFGRTIILQKDRRVSDSTGGDTRHHDNNHVGMMAHGNSNIDNNQDYQDRRNNYHVDSNRKNNYSNSDHQDRNRMNYNPQHNRSYPRDNDPPSFKRDRGDFNGPSNNHPSIGSGGYQNDQNKFPRGGQYNSFNRGMSRDRRESDEGGWHGPQHDSGDKNYRPSFRKGPPRYDSRHEGGILIGMYVVYTFIYLHLTLIPCM